MGGESGESVSALFRTRDLSWICRGRDPPAAHYVPRSPSPAAERRKRTTGSRDATSAPTPPPDAHVLVGRTGTLSSQAHDAALVPLPIANAAFRGPRTAFLPTVRPRSGSPARRGLAFGGPDHHEFGGRDGGHDDDHPAPLSDADAEGPGSGATVRVPLSPRHVSDMFPAFRSIVGSAELGVPSLALTAAEGGEDPPRGMRPGNVLARAPQGLARHKVPCREGGEGGRFLYILSFCFCFFTLNLTDHK
jgi:hypothetical protein